MATSITTNLNDDDEAILVRLTNEYNAGPPPPEALLTPAQFFREHARDWIRSQRARFVERDQLGMRAAYNAAPAAVQDQVDALLDPFR